MGCSLGKALAIENEGRVRFDLEEAVVDAGFDLAIAAEASVASPERPRREAMTFYATQSGRRIYALDIPFDDDPLHLPDLAKLGISDFQSKHPDCSLRNDDIEFGFEPA